MPFHITQPQLRNQILSRIIQRLSDLDTWVRSPHLFAITAAATCRKRCPPLLSLSPPKSQVDATLIL